MPRRKQLKIIKIPTASQSFHTNLSHFFLSVLKPNYFDIFTGDRPPSSLCGGGLLFPNPRKTYLAVRWSRTISITAYKLAIGGRRARKVTLLEAHPGGVQLSLKFTVKISYNVLPIIMLPVWPRLQHVDPTTPIPAGIISYSRGLGAPGVLSPVTRTHTMVSGGILRAALLPIPLFNSYESYDLSDF